MRFLGLRFSFGCLFPAVTTVYCIICMELVPLVVSFRTTAQCKHSFCRSCLSKYITKSIDGGVAIVRCPGYRDGLQCQAMLDPLWCKELVGSKSFLKWCDLACESSILCFARCYCPNLNCHEVIVDECGRKGDVKRFECPRCNRSGCFQCTAEWTEGHDCTSTQDVELSLLERLAKRKKWMRCPNCHMYVERKVGCNQIHCRCGRGFCYKCGRKRNGISPCLCILIPLSSPPFPNRHSL